MKSYSPAQLMAELERFPAPIVRDALAADASEGADILRDTVLGQVAVGERLLLTAGRFAAALYLQQARSGPRHHRGDGYIRDILLHQYNTGLALSLLSLGSELRLLPQLDGRALEHVARFAEFRFRSVGNFFRWTAQVSLSEMLMRLMESLGFLKGLKFSGDGRTVAYRQLGDVAVWPFLHLQTHDDAGRHILWGLVAPRRPPDGTDELPRHLMYVAHDDLVERESVVSLSTLDRVAFEEILAACGVRPADETTRDIFRVRSFIPLLTESHRRMERVVELLVKEADAETKREWASSFVEKRFSGMPEAAAANEVESILRDAVRLENVIIARCIEIDPVGILQEYLNKEPRDLQTCVKELCPTTPDGKNTLREIENAVSRFRLEIRPLFVGPPADFELEIQKERVRLGTFALARALGFNVRPTVVRPDINQMLNRLMPFLRSLRGRTRPERLTEALKQCAVLCEDVLAFVVRFYALLDHYDPAEPRGLSRPLPRQKMTLGRLVQTFRQVVKKLRKGEWPVIGRRYDYELEDIEEHLVFLDRFVALRNSEFHARDIMHEDFTGMPAGDQQRILRDVVRFLEMLECPPGGDPATSRIAPAVLHLNVITTNYCGVTTVRYMLRPDEGAVEPITLYTSQPVAAAPGVFYGLPSVERCTPEIWVDPVLFAADAFEQAKWGAS